MAWSTRPLINIRVETAPHKTVFRALWRSQRCIIPATAFYEWFGGERCRFELMQERVFAMAGLWQVEKGQGCFAILTTVANELIAEVHERMPVVLDRDHEDPWLMGERHLDLTCPFPADRMRVV